MTLKLKSILISLALTIIFTLVITLITYQLITVKFEQIEVQRVERNIRRIEAVINDRYRQTTGNLGDWTIWDDAYEFMENQKQEFVESNISQESFTSSNVDEALFINQAGELILSFRLDSLPKEENFPQDLYEHFEPGSELLDIDPEIGYSKGIIESDDGLLLYGIRRVYRSDGTGEPRGYIVFARYFDEQMINSVRELTQFEVEMALWNDEAMPHDYKEAKENYERSGQKGTVRVYDDKIIAGYLIVEDVWGKPVAIVRSDIQRDITLQGNASLVVVIGMLIVMAIVSAVVNHWMLVGGVLGKVSSIARDVDKLSREGRRGDRLISGLGSDEVDKLREEINTMLDSLQIEKEKGESLLDLINALVITIDPSGKVLMINKYGAALLGYSPEEVVGKDWIANFVPETDRDKVVKVFKEFKNDQINNFAEFENQVLTKDGKTRLISWHNTIVKDGDDQFVSTLSVGEDVTESRKRTNELERLNELMVDRELKMIEMKKMLKKT